MTKQYILIRAFVLMAGWGTLGFSQSDTTVLNQTEFRFPETHPGEVFLVKKVILSPKGSLPKAAAVNAEAAPSAPSSKSSALANRDLRGRFTQGGEYQKRMEQIRQRHGLPTLSASVQEPGRPFKVPKTFRMPEGSRFALASNSARIRNEKDLVAMERTEREAVRRKYGALSPEFSRQVEGMKEGEEMEVSIELAIEHPGYINGMKASLEEQKANARAWARAKTVLDRESLVRQYGLGRVEQEVPVPENKTSRILDVKASKAAILSLAHKSGILSIARKPKLETATIPGSDGTYFQEQVNSGYNPAGGMAFYEGPGVATMEFGLTQAFLNCLNSTDADKLPVNANLWTGSLSGASAHSDGMYHLLALGTPGHTARHHYATPTYRYTEIQDSIINYTIGTISTSIIVTRDAIDAADSRLVDNFAYVYPYPVVANAAGNDGHGYVPRNLTYNSLNVGNVQHYDLTQYRVDYQGWVSGIGVTEVPNSQSKNPTARYGSSNDWELPSLVAPGHTKDPYWGHRTPCVFADNALNQWDPGFGGTSLSAPVAAAMASNVQGALGGSSYLNPERSVLARAALLLTAQNVDSGYWDPANQDSRDGAGTVSGANAVNFALYAQSVSPYGLQSYVEAYSSGYYDSATIVPNVPMSFKYWVPANPPTGKHLRVVLTWTSSPAVTVSTDNELSDMGLLVYANDGWHSSDTWNSNVEIIDIPSGSVTPENEYTILAYPTTYRQAKGGPNLFYYAVAWTWVKDHAD
jgi:hypothetical protein